MGGGGVGGGCVARSCQQKIRENDRKEGRKEKEGGSIHTVMMHQISQYILIREES